MGYRIGVMGGYGLFFVVRPCRSMVYWLLVIGCITGVLTGLTGASGMSVLISGLLLAGLDIREVIGLTFAVTFCNAAAAIGPYLKNGEWAPRITWGTGLPAVAAVFLGHALGRTTSSGLLTGIVMTALLFAGIRFLTRKKSAAGKEPPVPREVPMAILIVVGMVLGTIMGIMGGGGSIFISLLLIFGCRLPIRMALGSSILIMGLAAIPGMVLSFNAHHLDPLLAVLLIGPSMVASFFASRCASRIPERGVEIVLGVYLVGISMILFYTRILAPNFAG